MSCLPPEQLLAQLAGDFGLDARLSAEAHRRECSACAQALNGILTVTEPLTHFLATTAPEATDDCPDAEELARWVDHPDFRSAGTRVSDHLARCEACAYTVAQIRLDSIHHLPPTASTATIKATPIAASAASLPLLPQVIGGIILAVVAIGLVITKLPKTNQAGTEPLNNAENSPASIAAWPIDAAFYYRLRGDSRTFTLPLPHRSPLQLSPDYEYAIQVRGTRAGYFLLFRVDSDHRLLLLTSDGDAQTRVSYELGPGAEIRFPHAPSWQVVDPTPGPRRFYAIFLEDKKQVDEILAQWDIVQSTGLSVSLLAHLDDFVVRSGCGIVGQPCALTLEFEVF
jgi:hypothetical protein